MSKYALSRRTLLRGAGVAVALCPLEAMFNANGTALAQGQAIPKRVLMFFWGNGAPLQYWVPSGTGSNFTLSASLQPLAPVRQYVRIISGTGAGGNGHAVGNTSTLKGGNANGPTLDQVAAAGLGATRYRSLQYGLLRGNPSGVLEQNLSFGPSGAPLPPEFSPRAAFDRLFAGVSTPAPGASPAPSRALDRKRSILDLVKRDVERLRPRLGAADAAKLDAHLTSIRELELSLAAPPPQSTATCAVPQAPGGGDAPTASRQFNQLIALAFACDQTRALSYMFGGVQCNAQMPWLSLPDHWHFMSHNPGSANTLYEKPTRWMVGELADLIAKLAATQEGAGKLIDSVMLIATTEHSAPGHNGSDLPLLLASGSAMLGGNVHWRGSGSSAAVGLSVLKAVGLNLSSFGQTSATVPLR